ncbi:MAG: alpha/beta fold hydrolase [Anaerolineae bacterium]
MSERLYHTTVQTNGISLPVMQAGTRDGRLVLLLHGFPEYWGIWRPQIEFLAQKGYCVWVPTQRGYGTAPKPHATADYALDTLARDIVGLIDAAGREKAVVVAHDWGSMVAWWLGKNTPSVLNDWRCLTRRIPMSFSTILRTIRA